MRFNKFVLATLVTGALLSSCGSKMTEEQINAKVDEQFAAKQTELDATASKQCEDQMATAVEVKATELAKAQFDADQAAAAAPVVPVAPGK
jgi:outer membrane murein-binding lipoprotein Lpp